MPLLITFNSMTPVNYDFDTKECGLALRILCTYAYSLYLTPRFYFQNPGEAWHELTMDSTIRTMILGLRVTVAISCVLLSIQSKYLEK